MAVLVFSWLTGILFWGLMNLLFSFQSIFRCNDNHSKKKCTWRWEPISNIFTWPFHSNNPDLIHIAKGNLQHKKSDYKKPEKSKLVKRYLEAYYRVQEAGLLGNVPTLESFSEFFKNLAIVLIYWIISIGIQYCFNTQYKFGVFNLSPIWECIIYLVIAFVSCIFRIVTEMLIHKNILEANQYLMANNKENKQSQ